MPPLHLSSDFQLCVICTGAGAIHACPSGERGAPASDRVRRHILYVKTLHCAFQLCVGHVVYAGHVLYDHMLSFSAIVQGIVNDVLFVTCTGNAKHRVCKHACVDVN